MVIRAAFSASTALAVTLPAAADEPRPEPAPAFQPGEISIGEPIALPAGGVDPAAAAGAAAAPTDDPRTAVPTPTAVAAVPGSGWLGLAVAESSVPGRWRIEEVTPGGPAARAGIAPGDELRAVNGVPMSSAEEVSQALTAIGAGQDVRVAVARADRVSDVVLRAETRPAPRSAEPARFPAPTTAPTTVQTPPQPLAPAPAQLPAQAPTQALPPSPAQPFARPPAEVAAPTPAQPVPPATLPPAPLPTPVAATPAPVPAANPDWQAARTEESVPSGSRFGRSAAEVPAPGPVTSPPPLAATPSPALPAPVASTSPASPSAPGRIALGVRTVPIDPALQARFSLDEPVGAYVYSVVQNLPAAKAGVPPGTVIVAIGDQPVRSPVELTKLVAGGPVDRPVTVQFVMPGGETRQAAVVLETLDPPLEQALTGGLERAGEPPTLQSPVPRRAERRPGTDDAIREEIRWLRARLDRLERLLPDLSPGRGR